MKDIERTQKQMFSLFSSLRGSVGYYNMFTNAIHLLFLKYLMSFSDRFERLGIESYKAIAAFKRRYDIARRGGEPLNAGDIYELFRTLDSEFLFPDVRLYDSLRVYDTLLEDRHDQMVILNILDQIDVEFSEEFLIQFLELLLQKCSRDVKSTGESITNKCLREIVVKLLDIKPKDTILNCFAGFSTLALSIPNDIHYVGYELNPGSYAISKMLLTMLGVKHPEIYNQDFLLSNNEIRYDKIFSDGPLNLRYDNPQAMLNLGVNTKEGNLLILYKVLQSLNYEGVAVVGVPGKVLFSNHPSYVEMRKRFQAEGLRAVISLPPLWAGTIVNTNLLVVDRKYHGPVMFIDAQKTGIKDSSRNIIISEENINKIVECYKNSQEIPGFSRLVSHAEIDERESWQPTLFIETLSVSKTRNVEDIDSELSDLYEDLRNNLK